MKQFLSIFTILLVLSGTALAAQEQGDVYEDDYIYTNNGAGDQFLKINLGALFPLNFGKQLYTGGIAELGYYRFLTQWFAVGGEFSATYNLSIGKKTLVMLPLTGGVLFQPTLSKFEFPLYMNVGLGYETWQNNHYFPSLIVKSSAGVFFRLNEMCSVGGSSTFMWVPQNTKSGLFLTASVGARYHF